MKAKETVEVRRFFGLLHHLEDALGCEVDLLTVNGLRNPYFKRRVLEERVPIYDLLQEPAGPRL